MTSNCISWYLLMVLLDKSNQSVINLLRVRGAEEMLAVLHHDKLGVGGVGKHLNLLLCVRDTVNGVARSVEPHDRAVNVEQSPVQTISFPKIDCRHPCASAAVISSVIALDGFVPEVSDAFVAILPKTDVDQEVGEFVVRFEVWGARL